MNLQAHTSEVLILLAENAKNNASPRVVDSETIANRLAMSLTETRQLLKVLDGFGFIMNDIDGQYSLITCKGMQWLSQGYTSI